VMSDMGSAMMGTGVASGDNRARKAAEMALNSPLLDDVDLNGAQGILVNITGGMNLSIGEFDEVGNTVRELAHEDATIVVGMVIDPEMEADIRVTVVATGLGRIEAARVAAAPEMTKVEAETSPKPVRLVKNDIVGSEPAYKDLDRPTVVRQQKPAAMPDHGRGNAAENIDMEYLDIPAFLRRQAD
jgi:cell division protein FtsZ